MKVDRKKIVKQFHALNQNHDWTSLEENFEFLHEEENGENLVMVVYTHRTSGLKICAMFQTIITNPGNFECRQYLRANFIE